MFKLGLSKKFTGIHNMFYTEFQFPGLHNLFHPTIRNGSTWSKFGAHGEHGDVFPVLQLRCARILRELNQIFIAYLFKGGQEQSFFPSKTLIYGISRDDSKNFNIRTCEHMILGQLRI